MDELEQKLGAILNDPSLMQQIGALAQSLGSQQQEDPAPEPNSPLDPNLLKNLAGMAAKSGTDNHQAALLHALEPYLPHTRVEKLEKAMRAAKMARLASVFLGGEGNPLFLGR